MCDRVKLYMKDKWDIYRYYGDSEMNNILRDKIGKDDYIGTTFINLSEVSAPGDNG